MTRVVNAIVRPLTGQAPAAPSGQSPFAWAVLAFVRRNFFNESPVITAVDVAGQQSTTGVITGNIDAIDPDELGKTVDVRASVYAGAAVPTDCGCAPEPGLIGLSFTNPAILGENPGDNWHAPAAVDNTCAYLNPEDFSVAFYRGTETGEVTIDGLGTGNVFLEFEGTLTEGGASEQSFATLIPELATGDLKGVTGKVTSVSSFNPDGSLNGVLTGTVVRPELRYVVVGKPAHGTVTVDRLTGAFTYTPDAGFAATGGADSFKVLVTEKRFNLLNLFRRYNGDPVTTINLNVAGTLV
ncbi:Ig-like domain-containing protein [Mycolicibacterium aurum]|nr:Ig-like domain-containing protein [Mycolicibacterium aurum]